MSRVARALVFMLCLGIVGCDAFSNPLQLQDPAAVTWVTRWSQIANDAIALDHTPPKTGDDRVWAQNAGPGRSARAMAIVHIAIFEAVNSIAGKFESYLDSPPAPANTNMKIAVAQAAHDTLVALYSGQTSQMDALLQEDLSSVADGPTKSNGIALGQQEIGRAHV